MCQLFVCLAPRRKVCSYNILFTDTFSSVEQIYLTQWTACCGGMKCAKLLVLPVSLNSMCPLVEHPLQWAPESEHHEGLEVTRTGL